MFPPELRRWRAIWGLLRFVSGAYLRRHSGQAGLIVATVALGVAAIVATGSLIESALASLEITREATAEHADLRVANGFAGVSEDLVEAVRGVEGVASAGGVLLGTARLRLAGGTVRRGDRGNRPAQRGGGASRIHLARAARGERRGGFPGAAGCDRARPLVCAATWHRAGLDARGRALERASPPLRGGSSRCELDQRAAGRRARRDGPARGAGDARPRRPRRCHRCEAGLSRGGPARAGAARSDRLRSRDGDGRRRRVARVGEPALRPAPGARPHGLHRDRRGRPRDPPRGRDRGVEAQIPTRRRARARRFEARPAGPPLRRGARARDRGRWSRRGARSAARRRRGGALPADGGVAVCADLQLGRAHLDAVPGGGMSPRSRRHLGRQHRACARGAEARERARGGEPEPAALARGAAPGSSGRPGCRGGYRIARARAAVAWTASALEPRPRLGCARADRSRLRSAAHSGGALARDDAAAARAAAPRPAARLAGPDLGSRAQRDGGRRHPARIGLRDLHGGGRRDRPRRRARLDARDAALGPGGDGRRIDRAPAFIPGDSRRSRAAAAGAARRRRSRARAPGRAALRRALGGDLRAQPAALRRAPARPGRGWGSRIGAPLDAGGGGRARDACLRGAQCA